MQEAARCSPIRRRWCREIAWRCLRRKNRLTTFLQTKGRFPEDGDRLSLYEISKAALKLLHPEIINFYPHQHAIKPSTILYFFSMLRMRVEVFARLLFRAADRPKESWIALRCSGADPSAAQKPSRKHFAVRVARLRLARRGG